MVSAGVAINTRRCVTLRSNSWAVVVETSDDWGPGNNSAIYGPCDKGTTATENMSKTVSAEAVPAISMIPRRDLTLWR